MTDQERLYKSTTELHQLSYQLDDLLIEANNLKIVLEHHVRDLEGCIAIIFRVEFPSSQMEEKQS